MRNGRIESAPFLERISLLMVSPIPVAEVTSSQAGAEASQPSAEGKSSSTRSYASRLGHPLCGSDPATLARVLRRSGGVPIKNWPILASIISSVALRTPFTLAECVYSRWRLNRTPEPAPPLFLLGHWRSGTTHLYNILSKSPELGYVPPLATGLPWDMLLLARAIRPLLERMLPKERYIDRIPVLPDSPQEDEAAMANMQPTSLYHGLYFPRRFTELVNNGVFFDGCSEKQIELWRKRFKLFVRKVSILQNGRRLVIKNPVYTARVGELVSMWPAAQFIHIHRNPYEVYVSMRNFYVKLFRELALQPYDESEIEEVVLSVYPKMMSRLDADAAELGEDRFIELRYDDLAASPIELVRTVTERFNLGDFDKALPYYQRYLDSIRGYQKNKYELDDAAAGRVAERWGPWIERWGYSRPS